MNSQERKALTKRLEDLAPRLIEELEAIAFGDGRRDDRLNAIALLGKLGNWGKGLPAVRRG